jgi:hypothetical protein
MRKRRCRRCDVSIVAKRRRWIGLALILAGLAIFGLLALWTGIPLEAKIMQQMEKLHRNHVPAAGKRPEMLSHDKGSRSRNSLLWLPRQVDGIPTS